jgi:hypothetical protein
MPHRKRYQFMMLDKGGNMVFRTCMVADIKYLTKILRWHGYRVIGVQEV